MENSLVVFISSVIVGMEAERQAAQDAVQAIPVTRPWLFEYSPASSLPLAESYLSKVRTCDIFVLLLGDTVTDPVKLEVETVQGVDKPMLVFLDASAPQPVVDYARSLGVKYATFDSPERLAAQVAEAMGDELITGYRRHQVPRSDLGPIGEFVDGVHSGALVITVQRDVIQTTGPVATEGSAISTGSGIAFTGDRNTVVGHIVNLYLAGGQWQEADYRVALDRYLAWVAAAMGKVVLRGIKSGGQQAVELDLDEVYVPLAAEALPEAREALKQTLRRQGKAQSMDEAVEPARQISIQELLREGQHLVVIGAPGCGKTTVLQHIAWTLAEALRTGRPELAAERLGLSGDLPLPIYVPLSLYAVHQRTFADHPDPHQRQLATFISHYLIDRQAGLNLPPDFFATLMNQGRHIILLLDGLDEVPNDDERALVSRAVQDLTHGRDQARFVVTSRTPAYQGRAVLSGNFRVVRVLPISPEQVAALISAAYRAIYPAEVEKDDRDRRAADLIDSVADLEAGRRERLGEDEESRLITTPLLVRMLLIVHFNLRRLPDQRAELYMEVVDTLLTSSHNPDEAVAQRLAQLGGDWRGRRDMAQYLAFQMHSRGEEAGRQIGEPDMVEELRRYLVERRHKSQQDADELVDDFVAASRQRGGLLEEQAGRYRFAHLGFQEFLTARHLAEGVRQVDRIAAFLEEDARLGQSWWREPTLLTLGYLNMTAPDAASELTHRLAHLIEGQRPLTAPALAGAELAATGFLEWGGAEKTSQDLADRLVELLEQRPLQGVPPLTRAAAGRALARLGDRRRGVGLAQNGLPDIVWCEVPAGSFTMGEGSDEHREPLDEPYAIGKYPITNAQFDAFVEDGGYTEKWRRCWTRAGWKWKERPRGASEGRWRV